MRAARPLFKCLSRVILLSLVVAIFTIHSIASADTKTSTATLQLSFPVNSMESDFLSALWLALPERFPGFKLNTIGRLPHITLLYLDNLTDTEARELALFFKNLSATTLQEYGLLDAVNVFESGDIPIQVVGNKSRFLAISPSQDFIQWQQRFYKLLSDKAPPWVLERHMAHSNLGQKALSPDSVHLSLLQFGDSIGIPVNESELKEAIAKLDTMLKSLSARFLTNANARPISFNPFEQALELVQPPRSLRQPGKHIFGVRLNPNSKQFQFNQTGAWPQENGSPIHFSIYPWLRTGQIKPVQHAIDARGLFPSQRAFTPIEPQAFINQIESPKLRTAYQASLRYIPPTFMPTQLADHNFFYPSTPHPELAPEKAEPIAKSVYALGLKSTPRISVGTGIYASSVRSTIAHPGDYDLSVLTMSHVPDSVETYEEAYKQAAEILFKDVIQKQLLKLVYKNKIAISELRIGSRAFMYNSDPANKVLSEDPFYDFFDNPYLTEDDVKRGFYVDPTTGKKWSVPELIALGDFTKGKIDLFVNPEGQPPERLEQSLQFLSGFTWRGQVYILNKKGLKGIPPLTRTQVYYGADSYAIAAAISYPHNLSRIPHGPVIFRFVRDITERAYKFAPASQKPSEKTVVFTSKLLKNFYNFFIFMSGSENELLQQYFNATHENFLKERPSSNFDPKTIFDRTLKVINQPLLATINHLRRIVNDFREFNERSQSFQDEALVARLNEAHTLANKIKRAYSTKKLMRSASPAMPYLENSLNQLITFLNTTKKMNAAQRIESMKGPWLHTLFHHIEHQLYELEHFIITHPRQSKTLTSDEQLWIQIFVERLPIWTWKISEQQNWRHAVVRKWSAATMEFVPTPENLARLDRLARDEHLLNRQDYLKRLNEIATYDKKSQSTPTQPPETVKPTDICRKILEDQNKH